MEKVILFTKNHWKKLCFASIPVIYGISYIKNEYTISRHMAHVCNIVNQYSIPNNNKVLVVLNPVANKKQCEKKFKKYCEPILHMAGYAVDVVKTKHIGHAKLLMESLEQLPDIVVVAGGDGTSSEVVTGLVRRNEEVCPILFLPLGEKNETAFSLMRSKINGNSEFVKNVSQCMLALVNGNVQSRPLIKYEVIENGSPAPSKPIFGIFGFSWGILNDIEINKEKYWYLGSLKKYVSLTIAALSKKINQNILTNIVSTPPCPGCNKCEIFMRSKSRFNFSKLLNPRLPCNPTHQIRESKLCSTEKLYKISAKQIDITSELNSESFFSLSTRAVENISSPADFVIDMMKENKIQPSISIESRTIEVIPIESDHQSYYIDGESYDARHIKISLLPNALKYFA